MVDTTRIREHMPVQDCNGLPIGTVDKLDAGRIKLTAAGSADGQHHFLPLSEISAVDEEKVTTQLSRDEVLRLLHSGAQRRHTEA
ncbi:DUF2171 domain-containing protein [Roseomonas sp. M0104]|uniref:DUF2171 domain-containing protein n=1 Tax=Teichococcus coralli TaxID=2545983 RepID=A0A845BAP2_9PROT|nr:DUF2171 domain-containing protein [Pseudoroseomonas coralli]MXP64673.1 DUF2171 domain-containing protein [Pseudoroseomonas coralli]